ncbi:Keratin-associated protein 26-1 [Heterocephalus glaber]|uniref:Keratin-associated protein n=1 Tax=Heterocephalus glaber TaxID=10181 RepID=G5AZU6_HETGA|nr:keratin-associated protein 26-1 [Heterocephalus glaber]EHB02557.1 Keratin-associated protein 26-1 [Heterocephalus glaber]
MSCRNSCSGNCSSESPRNSCHVPLNPAVALCSTSVSGGEILYLPSSCQDSIWFTDYSQGPCEESTSCQPAPCAPSLGGAACCSSTGHYVHRPCHGGSFLPASSFISSSSIPVSYRPLSYMSSSCHPLSPLVNTFQPAGCVSSGSVSSGYRPILCFSSPGRPLSVLPYGCQPSGSVVYRPQTVHVVSSGLRPVQPLSSGCQPLTSVVSPCHASCSAQGAQ